MELKKILSLGKPKTIILPESDDERVINAAEYISKEKTSKVLLISGLSKTNYKLRENKYLKYIDIKYSKEYSEQYKKILLRKNPDISNKELTLRLSNPLTFSCLLLSNGVADGVIAGSVFSTSEVIKNAIQITGLQKNNKTVSSFFLFYFPKKHRFESKIFAFADCGVIPNPTAEQTADITLQTSDNFKKLTGIKPKVAFLSFSTKGSAKDSSIDKTLSAIEITKKKNPKLILDGELQFDAAFVPEVAERKNPKGKIKGDANVFIFPDLNSANIAYKITERIGGAMATGPILQGLAKPVMDLSRGCKTEDIINMSYVINKF
ncbi:MAG TPA: phosphotransacetylase [Ignavibacteria bacterium]|nr:phosphotransacetylase [Ignavibacteria bacterium]